MSRLDAAIDPRDPQGHKAEEFRNMDKDEDGLLSLADMEAGFLERGMTTEVVQEVFEKLDDGEVGLLADPNKIIDKQERKINMEQFIAGWDAAVAGIVPLNMVCWRVKSRGLLIQVVATYCGLKAFKWDSDSANVPDDWKPAAPFEQLPVATFGQHVRIAHSMAIVRFIARKMGIDGENDWDFAMSEMLLEQYAETFNAAMLAQHAEERGPAWRTFFKGVFARGMVQVERLLNAQGRFCTREKLCVGELAIACLCNLMLDLEPTCLDPTPRLKAFYRQTQGISSLAKWLGDACPLRRYFSRD